MNAITRRIDPWIAASTLALLAMGLVNLRGLEGLDTTLRGGFALRQSLWIAIGLGAGAWTYRLARRDRHRELAWVFALGLGAVLLCLSGFHAEMRGVRRWMRLGPIVVQPSEALKLGVVAALARWFGDAPIGTRTWSRALGGVLAAVSLPVALVASQPDLGTAVLLIAIALSTLLVTPRAARSMGFVIGTTALPALLLPRLVMHEYQLARLRAFLDPARYAALAWQPMQARGALVSGRWFGAEQSLHALRHLPDARTDFALVAWANQCGVVALALAFAAYALLVTRVFAIARRATERYDLALVTGVGAVILWQTVMNAAMSLGAIPVVGVGAPLFSYGGSNMVLSLAAIGAALGVGARIEATPKGPGAPGPERLYRGAA